MFEAEFLLPAAKAGRLQKSWAHGFRTVMLEAVDEEPFREVFKSATGRPNKSVRLLIGLLLLKEMNDLTDEETLENLDYNLLWHYALAVAPSDAHTCQRTLHSFRVLLMEQERARKVFVDVTLALARAGKINLAKQRLDSTHIVSNIARLSRLGLFVETVTHFLRVLRRERFEAFAQVGAAVVERYLDRAGSFADARREEVQRKLLAVAKDVHALLVGFAAVGDVSELEAYRSLKRLFDEQCELKADDPPADGAGEPTTGPPAGDVEGGGASGTPGAPAGGRGSAGKAHTDLRVILRAAKLIRSDSLQSPHDPDVTYGRKGKGYEAQLVETYGDDNPFQLITGVDITPANASDQAATIPMLDRLTADGMKPTLLLADTAYGSGANIVSAAIRDVDLYAPVQDPTPTGMKPEASVSIEDFAIVSTCDEVVACPGGHAPVRQQYESGVLHAVFDGTVCAGCPLAHRCPTRVKKGDRHLRVGSAAAATAMRQADQRHLTFLSEYRKRSGIESTNHEIKGRHGLGSLRIRRKSRVLLAALFKALAVNVKRASRHYATCLRVGDPCPSRP
jgi:hypothetical protein